MAFGKLGAMGCRLGGAAKTIHKTFMIVAALVAFATEAHAFGNLGSMGRGFGHLGLTFLKKAPSAPVLWTPLYDPNLDAWWDASYLPSLTFNGSNISAWADRKNGIVASQGTGAAQPGWSATARNGTPGLTGNGSQTLVFPTNAFIPTGTNPSYAAVAAFTSASGNFEAAFGYGAAVAAQQRALGRYNSNNAYISIGNTDLQGTTWLNTDTYLEGVWSSATQAAYQNGTAFGPQAASFNTTLSSGTIFANIGNAIIFTGVIQDIVVSTGVPSISTQQKYQGWQSYKNGKNGADLPSGNPYAATGTLHRAPYVSDP